MMELMLIGAFVVSSILGYIIIKKVPSLLHTPLMSGTNALSGVTIIGAMISAVAAQNTITLIVALLAVVLAMVNVAGGFAITHRMLKMFDKGSSGKDGDK